MAEAIEAPLDRPLHVENRTMPVAPEWTPDAIADLFALPFLDLIFRAAQVHRARHPATAVQRATLLSIKTGGCPADCGYCSQSARHDSGLKAEKLAAVENVVQAAREARDAGSSRFCMGAAFRNPKERDMPRLTEMVRQVKALGLETCMTAGMLTRDQADSFAEAGLDYYNHNIDTSPEYYGQVITTRSFADRLNTISHVREAGISVCCGGIVGMGETRGDWVGFIHAFANMAPPPESVPINALVPIKGTPLGDVLIGTPMAAIDDIEFVRTVAVARIRMPGSMVRLSAEREALSDAAQALCFLAGANSMFSGEKLLTASNAGEDADDRLFARLGLEDLRTALPCGQTKGKDRTCARQ